MTYTIEITQTLTRNVRIKASSREAAIEKAESLCNEEAILLDDYDSIIEATDSRRFNCISESESNNEYDFDADEEEDI